MPGIYLSDPTATETTSSKTESPQVTPAVTGGVVTLPDGLSIGPETCGFTSGSTITCSLNSVCSDVGTYRGCCAASAEDCISTIYTICLDYSEAALAGDCGDHTLCCPAMMPSCFSYGYLSTAEERADQTLTYVQCQVTAGFGQLFPYPPEVMAMATATDNDTPSNEPSLEVQPTDKDSGGTSTGVIIGVVIGAIILIVLGIVAAWLLVRRRRQKAGLERTAAALDMTGTRVHDDKESGGDGTYQQQKQQELKNRPGLGAGRLRPLSTIQEQQPSPIASPLSAGAATTSLRDKRKSARRSQGPSWPLGSGNPLAAHPVDLEKRLSDQQAGGDGNNNSSSKRNSMGGNVPHLQISPPPPPGSRLAPPPPPQRSPRSSSSSQPHTPNSISAGLQSPRLSYVPLSPMDDAFTHRTDYGEDVNTGERARTPDAKSGARIAGATTSKDDDAARTASAIGLAIGRAPSARSARGMGTSRYVSGSGTTAAAAAAPVPLQDPVSPIEDEGEDENANDDDTDSKRLSFISAPSVTGDAPGDDALVSPITPKHHHDRPPSPDDDGAVSPATVSPVESRRGSVVGR